MALNTILSHPDQNSYVTIAEANDYLAIKQNYLHWAGLSTTQKEGFLKASALQMNELRFRGSEIYDRAKDYRKGQNLAFPRLRYGDVQYGNATSSTSTSVSILQLANQQYLPDDVFNGGVAVIREGTGRGQTVAITDWVSSTGTAIVASWTTQPDTTSAISLILPVDDKVKYAQIEQAYFLSQYKDEDVLNMISGVQSYNIGDLSETYSPSTVQFALVGGRPFSPLAQQSLKGLIDVTGYMHY
jgi:hypothetical protein